MCRIVQPIETVCNQVRGQIRKCRAVRMRVGQVNRATAPWRPYRRASKARPGEHQDQQRAQCGADSLAMLHGALGKTPALAHVDRQWVKPPSLVQSDSRDRGFGFGLLESYARGADRALHEDGRGGRLEDSSEKTTIGPIEQSASLTNGLMRFDSGPAMMLLCEGRADLLRAIDVLQVTIRLSRLLAAYL